MAGRTLRYFSQVSALSVIGLGILRLFLSLFNPSIDPHIIRMIFLESVAIIFVGFGIMSLSRPFLFITSRFSGILLISISLGMGTYGVILQNSIFHKSLFLFVISLFSFIYYLLIGFLLFFWRKERSSQIQLGYAFFVIFTTGGFSLFTLLADLLKFTNLHGIAHSLGAAAILIADAGLFSNVIPVEIFRRIDRFKQVVWAISFILLIFSLMLVFGIRLGENFPEREKLIYWQIFYALFAGVVFLGFSSTLFNFWFNCLIDLENVERTENELETLRKEHFEILKSVDIGVWKWDLKHNHVYWDFTINRFFQLDGTKLEGPGERILEKIHPDDRKIFTDSLNSVFENRRRSECIVRVIWSDGSFRFYNIRGDFITQSTGLAIVAGIILDITSIQHPERLLKLSEGVTHTLSKALNLHEGCKQILELFHSISGWEILALWMRDSAGKPFKCVVAESYPGVSAPQFIESTRVLKRDEEEPFLRTISSTMSPVIVEDLGKQPKYRRSQVAADEGIKGALVFPIIQNGNVIGIVELFKKEPYFHEIDLNLKTLLLGIGITIGEFLRRKSAETSEQELIQIVSSSHIPIFSCSLDTEILTWNKAAEKLFGWKAEEILDKKIEILIPEDRMYEFESLKHSFQEGRNLTRFRTQWKTKEGQLIPVEVSYSILIDTEIGNSRVSIVVYDISAEIASEEALLRLEEKYRSFVENIEEWIWEIDVTGTFIYSNQAVVNILGHNSNDVIGQSIYFYLAEEQKNPFKKKFEDCIEYKRGWSNQIFIWKDMQGKERISESVSFPIVDSGGVLIGFRGAERDVTEKKKIEKTKNEFISIVSHEIRAPLSSVHGALGLLTNQPDLPEKAKELIHLAYRNSTLLADLVKDIIDVEKIELGKFEFDMKRLFLADCIHESVQTAKLISQKTGVQIIEEKMLPEIEVLIDRVRFAQALGNLLSNAINFSPPNGTVFVSMEQIDSKVRVTVRDEGPGIPPEFEARIFGRFEQAVDGRGKQKGTGLGLNIAKTIVEQMGGKIGYISNAGQGAVFYMEFQIMDTVSR